MNTVTLTKTTRITSEGSILTTDPQVKETNTASLETAGEFETVPTIPSSTITTSFSETETNISLTTSEI